MKTRRGRLNVTDFISSEVIRKTSIVKESVRPYRLKVEGWVLVQARARGINVPKVLDYYHDKAGREVIVLERIQGQPLLWRSSQENIECMAKVGEQILALNNAPLDVGWGWIDPSTLTGNSESWKAFLLSYTQFYHKLLSRENVIEEPHFQTLYRLIDSIDFNSPKPCLVHRDIKPSNIVKGNDGRIWIIDWENAMLGDSLFDLATFGVRYGHGVLWESLVQKHELDPSSPRYIFYEIIILVGLIEFYLKYKINYGGRQKQLYRLIQRLIARREVSRSLTN